MTKQTNTPPPAAPKRILLVDDHPVVRFGLAQLIAQERDLTVYGQFSHPREALAALKPPLPDLVVTDLAMPGKSGMDLIREIRLQHPTLPVLVFSMHDEALYAERVLRAGANGFISKNDGSEKLLEAIRRVLRGEIHVSECVSSNILGVLAGSRPTRKNNLFSSLSDREFEIFTLLSTAMSTNEIAGQLSISPKTVETHCLHIREKMKLKSGAEVRKYAVRWGASQNMI